MAAGGREEELRLVQAMWAGQKLDALVASWQVRACDAAQPPSAV